MPLQQLRVGLMLELWRENQLASVQRVVRLSILMVLSQPLAHLDSVVRRHGDVAVVEELMEVRPEQQTVTRFVRPPSARMA